MENRPEEKLTPQEQLAQLREERERISKQMQSYSLTDSDQSRFAVLVRRAETIDGDIDELQKSIEPEMGHGEMSKHTLRGAVGPEPDRF